MKNTTITAEQAAKILLIYEKFLSDMALTPDILKDDWGFTVKEIHEEFLATLPMNGGEWVVPEKFAGFDEHSFALEYDL